MYLTRMNYDQFRDLDWFFRPQGQKQVARYPLTNLGVDEDNTLYIEVAVAGFSKEDVELELKGNQLHIIGSKDEEIIEKEINYIQKHISSNDFERIITLHENYVGGDISASVKEGILSIKVKPKEPTRKLIAIGD